MAETPKDHFDFLQATQELSTQAGGTGLAAAATATGVTYDCGNITGKSSLPANMQYPSAGHASPAFFRAFAASDQEGTLEIQQSPDKVNWFTTDGATNNVTAGFTNGVYIESKIVLRYVRAILTNGSTEQTHVEFDTALVSA